MKRYAPFAIIGAVLAIAVALVIVFSRPAHKADGSQFQSPPKAGNTSDPKAGTTSENSQAKGASPYAPLDATAPGAQPPHVRGAANAPVTLEEFGDYQCPPCGALFREMQKIETEYKDRISFVFRHYPIVERHKNALVAAHAAEAAGVQNKYWEMHDRLYETQQDWAEAADARSIFIAYATDLKLDLDRFKRDMDGPEADARIVADRQRAQVLGVQGTPTLFVNGRQLRAEAMTPEKIRQAIEYMLNQPAK